MNIIVCDDDINCANNITQLLRKVKSDNSKIISCNTANDLLTLIEKIEIDILYLDIELGNDNGITLAKQIRKTNDKIIIIFITSYDSYVTDAFEVFAFQYIRKPIDNELFYAQFYRAKKHYEDHNIKIKIKDRGIIYSLSPNEIIYIECYYRKTEVMTTSGKVSTTNTFKSLIEMLCPFDFVRVHQSYYVNLAHVKYLEKNEITFYNGKKVDVSSYKYANVQKKFNLYLNKGNHR